MKIIMLVLDTKKLRERKKKNKRKKNKEQAAEVEREQKRNALERYIGYYDHYLEYDKYLKNSDTMKETTKKKNAIASRRTNYFSRS